MSVLSITNQTGTVKIPEGIRTIAFDFDISVSTVVRFENDLLLTTPEGSEIVIEDFFVTEELPRFQLPGGVESDCADILQAANPDIDLSLAAGPASTSPPSSGLNNYSDTGGDLIGGVDRLGTLNGQGFQRTGRLLPADDTTAGEITAGIVTPPVQSFMPYSLRAILDNSLDGNTVSLSGVTVNNFTWLPAGAHNPNDYFDISHVGGLLTVTLKAGITSSMLPAHLFSYLQVETVEHGTVNVQFVYSSSQDYSSTSIDGLSGNQTDGYLEGGKLLAGEWYSSIVEGTGDITSLTNSTITTSALGDSITISAQSTDGGTEVALDGTVIHSDPSGGAGNDTMHITGAVNSSEIHAGGGDNTLEIIGNTDSSTVTAGAGNDIVIITGDVQSNTSISTGAGDDEINIVGSISGASTLSAGAGDDTINITGNVTSGSIIDAGDGTNMVTLIGSITDASIVGAANDDTVRVIGTVTGSTINVGAGNNTVVLEDTVRNGTIIAGAGDDEISFSRQKQLIDSIIDAGDGANTITAGAVLHSTISGGDDKDIIAVDVLNSSTIMAGDGDNDISINSLSSVYSVKESSITTGNGADTITLNKTYLNDSSIVSGAGDDTIVINNQDAFGDALGLFNKAVVDVGAGNDTLEINVSSTTGNALGLYGSTITAGDGDTAIKITADSTGTGYSASGLGNHSSITTAAGDDTIEIIATGATQSVAVDNSTIETGAGKDTINLTGDVQSNAKIDTGADDDIIHILGSVSGSSIIDAGAGNDEIEIIGNVTTSTISAGAGNDSIKVTGNVSTGSLITGDGTNEVILTGNFSSSTLTGGAGSDSILVTGIVTGSSINVGEGNNTVQVDGGVNTASTISAGAGDDTFIFGTQKQINKSTIDAGNGTNTILAGAVVQSTIKSGSGDDILTFVSLNGSIVDAQGGDNTITVNAPYSLLSVKDSSITTGNGADTITLNNTYLNNSSVTSGAGDDTIVINNQDAFGDALGLFSKAVVDVGAGNDTLEINVSSNVGNSLGLYDSEIVAGDGDTTIKITADSTGTGYSASGLENNSSITTGSGNDFIEIIATGEQKSIALDHSTIATGDGGDVVLLTGDVANSQIDLGAGDDIIMINGSLDSLTTVNGGSGNDIFVYNHYDSGASNTIELADDGSISINGIKTGAMGFEGLGGGTGSDFFVASANDDFFFWGVNTVNSNAVDTISSFEFGADTILLSEQLFTDWAGVGRIQDYITIDASTNTISIYADDTKSSMLQEIEYTATNSFSQIELDQMLINGEIIRVTA